jgi:hypothetical protein
MQNPAVQSQPTVYLCAELLLYRRVVNISTQEIRQDEFTTQLSGKVYESGDQLIPDQPVRYYISSFHFRRTLIEPPAKPGPDFSEMIWSLLI